MRIDSTTARIAALAGLALGLAAPASAGRGTKIDEPYGSPSCQLGATWCQSVDISASGLFSRAYIYQEGIVSLDALLPAGANAADPASLGTGWWFAPGLNAGARYFVNAFRQPSTADRPVAYGLNFFREDNLPVGAIPVAPAMQVMIGSGTGQRPVDHARGGWDGIAISFGYEAAGLPAPGALIGMSWNDGQTQVVRNADGLLVGPRAADTDFLSTAGIRLADGSRSAATRFVPLYATAGAAVPEPASWAMMIGGFGLTGAAMRRRRHGRATA